MRVHPEVQNFTLLNTNCYRIYTTFKCLEQQLHPFLTLQSSNEIAEKIVENHCKWFETKMLATFFRGLPVGLKFDSSKAFVYFEL